MKRFVSVALAVGLVAGLAGCVASQPDKTSPAKSPISSPSTSPGTAKGCPELSQEAVKALANAAPLEEVEDQYGSYCHLTFNESTVEDALAKSVLDSSLKQYGFTDTDARNASVAALKFFVENTADNPGLDDDTFDYANWMKSLNIGDMLKDSSLKKLADSSSEPFNTGLVISSRFPNPIIREGQSRIENLVTEVSNVYAAQPNEQPIIGVKISATLVLPTTNKQVAGMLVKAGKYATEEEAVSAYPQLADSDKPNEVVVGGWFVYSFYKNSYDTVVGVKDDYHANSSDGIVLFE